MLDNGRILIGKGEKPVYLEPTMANRHGLIAGATGTGKTITIKVLAESFSEMGVPVFLADIKGDLAGTCKKGEESEGVLKRVDKLALDNFDFKSFPVRFYDVFGEKGHPIRTTVSDMGPILLSRLLNLTEIQTGVLNIVFHIADDSDLLLIDLKDLRSMLTFVGNHLNEFTLEYGNMTKQSIGAIQRALLVLEDEGGNLFFGEPMMDINDFLALDKGKGIINILDCVKLYRKPTVYTTFLIWLLSELFENLPEVGDLDKPKMIFFFDEAHLLFDDAPKMLVQQIEQTVKLIRSKGVGVYFATQNPTDIPDAVLAQLNNRIQHSLRAYTPAEIKKVKSAAQSFRENPNFDTTEVITELKTGEALISCLDSEGLPAVVERTTVCPPQSFMGTIDDQRRNAVIQSSDIYGKYEEIIDRESAYEKLDEVLEREYQEKNAPKQSSKRNVYERAATNAMSTFTRETTKDLVDSIIYRKDTSRRKSSVQKAADSAIRTISGEFGRKLSRGLFDIFKK